MRFHPVLYPIFLNLRGRSVLVVGGGGVAARKARALLRAGARVTVVSPRLAPGFPKGVRHLERRYRSSDNKGVLVFAATDDRAVNRAVSRDARRHGALANLADDPEISDFHVPAVARRGSLAIAVSTGGASPVIARAIRKRLQGALGSVRGDDLGRFSLLLRRISDRRQKWLLRRPAP